MSERDPHPGSLPEGEGEKAAVNAGNAYFDRTIKSAMTFLSRWKGANAEMWELTTSHKSLGILLRRENEGKNLLLACLDPLTINGSIKWLDCNLRIETETRGKIGETVVRVLDDAAGVEIVCGGLEVKENVKL